MYNKRDYCIFYDKHETVLVGERLLLPRTSG